MPEHQRPLKVFLSYSSQDRHIVRELSRRLAGEGWIDPWVDEKKLLPGQEWRTKIEEAVETSDVVIICLSNNSVTKEGFVQKELRYAREIAFEKPDETIFLIPLRLEDCSVPRGLRFYQWADYFGEQRDETYSVLLESLKLRHNQKLKIEEELAHRERERQERQAADKVARESAKREAAEKVERENAEKVAQEKIARDLADKAKREKEEREAAEKAGQEKLKRDVAEKSKRERAERLAAQLAILKELPSKYWTALRSNLPKVEPYLRIAGFAGIAIVLFWVGLLGVPKLASLMPTPKANSTPRLHPSATVTFTVTPIKPTKTLTPQPIPTKTQTPAPTALPTEIMDAKGVSMVLVPAGNFIMGSNTGSDNEKPAHTLYLNTFYIDKFEVTNARYKECVESNVCQVPKYPYKHFGTTEVYFGNPQYDDYPVVFVDWFMAKNYCEWRESRLPTEAEWEKAARGIDGRTYPWGENIGCEYSNYNYCNEGISSVGMYEKGKSVFGVYDMFGNAQEWVSSLYQSYPYDESDGRENLASEGKRMVRDVSWAGQHAYYNVIRLTFRLPRDPTKYDNSVSIRCARDVTP